MTGLCLREIPRKRPNRTGMDSTGGNIFSDGGLATKQTKELVSKKAGREGSVYVCPITGDGTRMQSTTKALGNFWCG